MRSYAALRLRPRHGNTPIRGREPMRAHRGACMYCSSFCIVAGGLSARQKPFDGLLPPLCVLLLVLTFNRPLCAKSERLRAKIIAYA